MWLTSLKFCQSSSYSHSCDSTLQRWPLSRLIWILSPSNLFYFLASQQIWTPLGFLGNSSRVSPTYLRQNPDELGSQLLETGPHMFPSPTMLILTCKPCSGKEQPEKRGFSGIHFWWRHLAPGGPCACLPCAWSKRGLGPGAAASVVKPGGSAHSGIQGLVTAEVPRSLSHPWLGTLFLEVGSLFLRCFENITGSLVHSFLLNPPWLVIVTGNC